MVIASFLSPEMEDTVATWIALFVLFIVPIVLIALFWMVHILPEKIAHKRHHPQFEAIRTVCLLSLVFGGMLWPIAWIWAYTKPVVHKIAYGTDKASHDVDEEGSAWDEHAKPALASAPAVAPAPPVAPPLVPPGLHNRLARLEAAGIPGDDLKAIRASIEALEAKVSKQGA